MPTPETLLEGKSPVLRQKIETALTEYLDGIAPLGLVDRVLLRIDPSTGRAHFFNIFTRDVQLNEATGPEWPQLTSLGGMLEMALLPEVDSIVTYVQPSKMDGLLAKFQELGNKESELKVTQNL